MPVTGGIVSTNDGRVQSSDASYATALAGAALGVNATGYYGACGCEYSGGTYTIRQMFFDLDTAVIPDGDAVQGAGFVLRPYAAVTQPGVVLELYAFNWGGTLTTASWRTPTQLAAMTLLASYDIDSMGWDTGTDARFTSTADFAGAINKTGHTYLMVASKGNRLSTTPTALSSASMNFAENAGAISPRLYVSHYTPSAGTDTGDGPLLKSSWLQDVNQLYPWIDNYG